MSNKGSPQEEKSNTMLGAAMEVLAAITFIAIAVFLAISLGRRQSNIIDQNYKSFIKQVHERIPGHVKLILGGSTPITGPSSFSSSGGIYGNAYTVIVGKNEYIITFNDNGHASSVIELSTHTAG